LEDGNWAVVSPDGRYDASNAGDVKGLHWVVNNESFDLKQFKQRYYEPGLLSKLLGFNKEPLRSVSALQNVKLFPAVQTSAVGVDGKLTLNLLNRGGGIGRVQVFVNDKELLADARGPKLNPQSTKATVTVDLSLSPALLPGQKNTVRIVTWNNEGYLSSRGITRDWKPKSAPLEKPRLWAIVCGVSEYSNESLNLRFAAKDAQDMAQALRLGANRLFGADKVNLTLLSSQGGQKPTKSNIQKAFSAARKAKANDIIVVYFAGHGVAIEKNNSLYCYLTQEARAADAQTLSDPVVRAQTTISSEELTEWIKKIPALKQVMVLDTCAAAAASRKLTDGRSMSGDQVRALDRMKDRTGFHILMGCASDAVSYEATRFQQGLLTYSLLLGMKGASLGAGNMVDVSQLFNYAADQVPLLAKGIGGIQRPQIAAPKGTSFAIGELQVDDKKLIPLSTEKPLLLRPVLLNPEVTDDDLNLSMLLAKRLRDEDLAARGQANAVYIDAEELPGAIQIKGTYTRVGELVVLKIVLRRDGKIIKTLQIEHSKNDVNSLIEKIAHDVSSDLPLETKEVKS
jgi:hypothetical protein